MTTLRRSALLSALFTASTLLGATHAGAAPKRAKAPTAPAESVPVALAPVAAAPEPPPVPAPVPAPPPDDSAARVERMGSVLHASGDAARSSRVFVGVASIVVGAAATPIGIATSARSNATKTEKGIGQAVTIWGLASAVGGVLTLTFNREPEEKLAEAFDARKGAQMPNAKLLAEMDQEWREAGERERNARKIGGVVGLVVGVGSVAVGSIFLLTKPSVLDREPQQVLGAALVGLGTVAVYSGGRTLLTQGAIESSYAAYMKPTPSTALSRSSRQASLGISPMPGGGGYVSFGTTF